MLFLSREEKQDWLALCSEAIASDGEPGEISDDVRPQLRPYFCFYVGARLAAGGDASKGLKWFAAGAQDEEETLLLNAFTVSFLKRQGGRFAMPEAVFADPMPYVHFTGVPAIRSSRHALIRQCGTTLPDFRRPLRIVDIGCGDGALIVDVLTHLLESGRTREVGEIALIDASPAMVAMARDKVAKGFPSAPVRAIDARIQDVASRLGGRYDVALMSLSYHHMPWEDKVRHLEELRDVVDNFLLFEVNANNDRPELGSPELAVSVYQAYGRLIDAVFAHDAPVELTHACVDRFLMAEVVSILSQPRGVRTDYLMLRSEWHEVFDEALGDGFSCRCDDTAYADDYMELFTLHYGRS